jgi:excisionase family DNA binding protein
MSTVEVPNLLSLAEVAMKLGVSAATVRRIEASGDLPAVRVRRQLRFDPADVRAYLGMPESEAA